jgi:hypothetical protein
MASKTRGSTGVVALKWSEVCVFSERHSLLYLHVEVNRPSLFGDSIVPLW